MGLSIVIITIVTKIFYKQIFESNLIFHGSEEIVSPTKHVTTTKLNEVEYENVSMSFSPVKNKNNDIFNASPDATGFNDSADDDNSDFDAMMPEYRDSSSITSNLKRKPFRRKTLATSTYKLTPTIFVPKPKRKSILEKINIFKSQKPNDSSTPKAFKRYLTEDEYLDQSFNYTQHQLEKLREHCQNSPKISSWKTVSKLADPKRFSNFVAGRRHVTQTELLEYEDELDRSQEVSKNLGNEEEFINEKNGEDDDEASDASDLDILETEEIENFDQPTIIETSQKSKSKSPVKIVRRSPEPIDQEILSKLEKSLKRKNSPIKLKNNDKSPGRKSLGRSRIPTNVNKPVVPIRVSDRRRK